uniref:Uncharacterized protein n=1 Tax=Eptatretus burgeri TaxID=7764 RepID=A0A8C4QQ07_EPTBU
MLDAPSSQSSSQSGQLGYKWLSRSTPTVKCKRAKFRRRRKVGSKQEQVGLKLEPGGAALLMERLQCESHRRMCSNRNTGVHCSRPSSSSSMYLPLPLIKITPSSDDEGGSWSRSSTPSGSPRRRKSLLRKWLRARDQSLSEDGDSLDCIPKI